MEYAAENFHFTLSDFHNFHTVANFAEIGPSQQIHALQHLVLALLLLCMCVLVLDVCL